jgi:hypothetical protein
VHTREVTPLDYVSPLFALMCVIGLGFAGRWVFAPNIRKHRKDYGLLVPIVTITAKVEAEAVRDRLIAAGLRATLGESHAITRVSHDGFVVKQPPGHHVLVFPQDVERAKNVLSP